MGKVFNTVLYGTGGTSEIKITGIAGDIVRVYYEDEISYEEFIIPENKALTYQAKKVGKYRVEILIPQKSSASLIKTFQVNKNKEYLIQ